MTSTSPGSPTLATVAILVCRRRRGCLLIAEPVSEPKTVWPQRDFASIRHSLAVFIWHHFFALVSHSPNPLLCQRLYDLSKILSNTRHNSRALSGTTCSPPINHSPNLFLCQRPYNLSEILSNIRHSLAVFTWHHLLAVVENSSNLLVLILSDRVSHNFSSSLRTSCTLASPQL